MTAILSLLRPAEPVEAAKRDTWNWRKHDEIIKRLMEQVGMPNSRSLYQAFKQFVNELHHIDLGASATAPKPPAQPDTSELLKLAYDNMFDGEAREQIRRKLFE